MAEYKSFNDLIVGEVSKILDSNIDYKTMKTEYEKANALFKVGYNGYNLRLIAQFHGNYNNDILKNFIHEWKYVKREKLQSKFEKTIFNKNKTKIKEEIDEGNRVLHDCEEILKAYDELNKIIETEGGYSLDDELFYKKPSYIHKREEKINKIETETIQQVLEQNKNNPYIIEIKETLKKFSNYEHNQLMGELKYRVARGQIDKLAMMACGILNDEAVKRKAEPEVVQEGQEIEIE